MSDIDDGAVLNRLGELLSAHGVVAEKQDFWLVTSTGCALSAAAEISTETKNGTTLRLDVDVSLPDRRLITESFAGTGDGRTFALSDAFDNFCRSSLHVLLTGLFGFPEKDQVTVEEWEIGGCRWRVTIGNFTSRTSNGTPKVQVPDTLFAAIEKAVRASPLSQNEHWFRTFYCQIEGETAAEEWLMDNDTWQAAIQPLSAIAWPSSAGYYSIRNFMLLRRADPVPIIPLSIDAGLRVGLEVVLQSWADETSSDADTYRRLTHAGVDPELAERLIVFVPLGFSSVFLRGAQLPATFQAVGSGDKLGPEQKLGDEPSFVAARTRALEATRAELIAVAMRCALVNAAAQAVDDVTSLTPERLRDFRFTPPTVFIPRFSPPPRTKKPWWQLW